MPRRTHRAHQSTCGRPLRVPHTVPPHRDRKTLRLMQHTSAPQPPPAATPPAPTLTNRARPEPPRSTPPSCARRAALPAGPQARACQRGAARAPSTNASLDATAAQLQRPLLHRAGTARAQHDLVPAKRVKIEPEHADSAPQDRRYRTYSVLRVVTASARCESVPASTAAPSPTRRRPPRRDNARRPTTRRHHKPRARERARARGGAAARRAQRQEPHPSPEQAQARASASCAARGGAAQAGAPQVLADTRTHTHTHTHTHREREREGQRSALARSAGVSANIINATCR